MSTTSTSASARSIQEEILDLANVLEDSQTRLRQLVLRVESQDVQTWQSRFEDMEKAHKEAVNSAKWLRAQNAELEQQLGQHRPAIDNALSAREAAFRRLKHARKVIRDLLDERRDMLSPRTGGSLTQQEIDEALYDEFHRDQDSSSSSSDSDKTARLAPHSPSRDINTPEPSQRSYPVSPSQNVPMNTPLPSGSAGTSVTSIQLSPQRPSPRGSPEAMYIHFKKPPGSSALCAGPLSWEELESSLKLDEDTMNSLQSLSLSKDLSMRLQLVRVGEHNFAFLYDPIFLDTRKRSYILDWGRAQTNTNIE
ncbi:hypothetical protein NLJ89_g88 [Agrocybe chaxingu]|uniref:Uncharacterized protein n=1 Tax=Agrocybe chaxingu TaxID=84603 RepID=A0A9W8N2I9_9AGAR|nr:hypothetical protein NLJ89_g88 [Agrocybe chaxingu]